MPSWGGSHIANVSDLRNKIDMVAGVCSTWGLDTFGGVRKEIRELRKKLVLVRSDPNRVGPTHEERKVE
jgi:hypothetical protein